MAEKKPKLQLIQGGRTEASDLLEVAHALENMPMREGLEELWRIKRKRARPADKELRVLPPVTLEEVSAAPEHSDD